MDDQISSPRFTTMQFPRTSLIRRVFIETLEYNMSVAKNRQIDDYKLFRNFVISYVYNVLHLALK